MNPIVVVLISTGDRYTSYILPLIASLKKFFPPCDVILFSDSEESFDAIKVYQPNLGWPRATLTRYHAMLAQRELLSKYNYVFYLDVDMVVTRKIESEEICGDGLTAVLHPGFPTAFERRQESTAYVQGNPPYYQGCFIGGERDEFLEMCQDIKSGIDADDKKDIVATWLDESHLNHYLASHYHSPAIVLPPTWAWPDPPTFDELGRNHYFTQLQKWGEGQEVDFTPVILHRQKPLKILIAIESCVRDMQNGSHQVIRETWGRDLINVDLKFFIGSSEEKRELQNDEIQVNAGDDYEHLSFKTKEIFRWSVTQGYDFIFKCDVDTFILPSRLFACQFERHDYTGFFTTNPHAKYHYASGGIGYFLSRRAAGAVIDSVPSAGLHTWCEDLWVGQVLGPKIQTAENPEGEFSELQPTKFENYMAWHVNTNRHGPERNHKWLRSHYANRGNL